MNGESQNLYEHSAESFHTLIDAIAALGFNRKTAGYYAAQIGDTPVFDDAGRIVIQDDHGNVVDRLALDYFDS